MPEKNVLYEERESGITHSPFELEFFVFTSIRHGNVNAVEQAIKEYMEKGIVMGKMSLDPIRQIRYWAVSTVAVAIHYAILGGLDETVAFNLSDEYIRYIDHLTKPDECIDYLCEKAKELTVLVSRSGLESNSILVKRTVHYISIHLHERLKVDDIAKNLGVSKDYLSNQFSKNVGEGIHEYIIKTKLKESIPMLMNGMKYTEISYNLNFSSESHYISSFRKYYGMTPREYIYALTNEKTDKQI
ncbi:MAG: AraC family transcriptional regulator [Lachnospiraceae bacterium]|nr:AraC family transcriptional regulator [Lachnospiraceae bacterium]